MMRKLQHPLKLLLNNARSSATLAVERSFSAPRPLSRLVLDSLRSWRPANGRASAPKPSSYALFRCPSVSKGAMLPGTHLSVGLQCLLDRGVGSLKMSLQRKGFNSSRGFFSSGQGLWSYWMPTSDNIVFILIGANVAVFALWRIADTTYMQKNFMLSLENIKNGRLHTLVTSAFSHRDADHIISNMIGLYFFGESIAKLLGAEFLLNLYLAGAIGGSIFFLVQKAFLSPSLEGKYRSDPLRVYALGASAAVNAIILLYVFLFPRRIVYLNLIIPVPAILMGAIFIGSDLWRISKGDSRVSGAAHMGGAAVAALAFARVKGFI